MVYQSSMPPALNPPQIFTQNKIYILHRIKIRIALKNHNYFTKNLKVLGKYFLSTKIIVAIIFVKTSSQKFDSVRNKPMVLNMSGLHRVLKMLLVLNLPWLYRVRIARIISEYV